MNSGPHLRTWLNYVLLYQNKAIQSLIYESLTLINNFYKIHYAVNGWFNFL